jgi:hypothetical protein
MLDRSCYDRAMRVWLVVAIGVASRAASAGDVELLHGVAAQVAVSSQVKNPNISPQDLVDGDPKTAWNSLTGELAGAWIAFRVPAEVEVASIKLIVGNTGSGKEGDYFPLNPRIKKVRVTRDGTSLGEHALDPEQRGLQTIAIGKPGGEYRIEVLEVVPGKNPKWREVCVSELEVWGTLPAQMKLRHRKAFVGVGKLPEPPLAFFDMRGPYPNLPALCDRERCKVGDPGLEPSHVAAKGPILDAQLVREARGTYDVPVLALRTDKGWWWAGSATWLVPESPLPGHVDAFAIGPDGVSLTITRHGGGHDKVTSTFLCGVGASHKPRCLTPVVTDGWVAKTQEIRLNKMSITDGWLSIDPEERSFDKSLAGDYKLAW